MRNKPVCHLRLKTERESTTCKRGCRRVGCTRAENCAQMSFVPSFALFFWSLESRHALSLSPIICPHTPNNNSTRLHYMHQGRACGSKDKREGEKGVYICQQHQQSKMDGMRLFAQTEKDRRERKRDANRIWLFWCSSERCVASKKDKGGRMDGEDRAELFMYDCIADGQINSETACPCASD